MTTCLKADNFLRMRGGVYRVIESSEIQGLFRTAWIVSRHCQPLDSVPTFGDRYRELRPFECRSSHRRLRWLRRDFFSEYRRQREGSRRRNGLDFFEVFLNCPAFLAPSLTSGRSSGYASFDSNPCYCHQIHLHSRKSVGWPSGLLLIGAPSFLRVSRRRLRAGSDIIGRDYIPSRSGRVAVVADC